jgi:hypothetical protein
MSIELVKKSPIVQRAKPKDTQASSGAGPSLSGRSEAISAKNWNAFYSTIGNKKSGILQKKA